MASHQREYSSAQIKLDQANARMKEMEKEREQWVKEMLALRRKHLDLHIKYAQKFEEVEHLREMLQTSNDPGIRDPSFFEKLKPRFDSLFTRLRSLANIQQDVEERPATPPASFEGLCTILDHKERILERYVRVEEDTFQLYPKNYDKIPHPKSKESFTFNENTIYETDKELPSVGVQFENDGKKKQICFHPENEEKLHSMVSCLWDLKEKYAQN